MTRKVLPNEKLSPEALESISHFHSNILQEAMLAVETNKIVIIGMGHNPFVIKARKALSEAKIEFKYLEYGNYFSAWKKRLAIKLWSGWPTYPQVFVEGKLVGGYKEIKNLIERGLIK